MRELHHNGSLACPTCVVTAPSRPCSSLRWGGAQAQASLCRIQQLWQASGTHVARSMRLADTAQASQACASRRQHSMLAAEGLPAWPCSMKQDPAAEKAFGWILEMYAFTIAASQQPGGPLTFGLHPDMMIQPPWDSTLQVKGNNTFILHFTYGNDYNEQVCCPLGEVLSCFPCAFLGATGSSGA